ncbi:ATP synthase F1 subunit gamma [Candidatus Roizmanbacteria bacterium]|nr:ATP synthase F1 subunit gamma [Candidatus Roizmanbacteria bacterium]
MNIRQARKKIKSVGNVRKITKAMQLVSAVKMKKAQQLALEGEPYQMHLEAMIKRIILNVDPNYSKLLSTPKESVRKKDLAIVIASNKGLCGGFNMNLFRFIIKNTAMKNTDFAIVGKKANLLPRFSASIIADYSSNYPLDGVSAIFNLALTKFLEHTYSRVYLFYNNFISMLRVDPVKDTLFPLTLQLTKEVEEKDPSSVYLIEPSPAEIINPLLYSYIEQKIQHAIIQSEAGEHSSRMIAMKNATENANDVIYNLTMLRNKLRQEKITNELLDMVTAKESVEAS